MQEDGQLWYFMMEGAIDEEHNGFGNFYAWGKHCGDALKYVYEAAESEGFLFAQPVEAEYMDDESYIPEGAVRVNDHVYTMEKYLYPADEPASFKPPTGIIRSACDERDDDYEHVKDYFAAYKKNEEGFFGLYLNVSRNNLKEMFYDAIDFLPEIDKFYLEVNDYFYGDEVEVCSSGMTEKDEIMEFLNKNSCDTLENGFVSITVCCADTQLTLKSHKVISFLTKDEEIFHNYYRFIKKHGIEQTKRFYTLECDFYHWHYRLADSREYADFMNMLKINGFELQY